MEAGAGALGVQRGADAAVRLHGLFARGAGAEGACESTPNSASAGLRQGCVAVRRDSSSRGGALPRGARTVAQHGLHALGVLGHERLADALWVVRRRHNCTDDAACWIVGLLACWLVGLLACWIVGLLDLCARPAVRSAAQCAG